MVDRKRYPSKNHARAGQAMAEFLVGLVGIMLLVVGLQQVALVSRGSFDAHINVRRLLAEQMTDPMSNYSGDYAFFPTTDPGLDDKKYTGDDVRVTGDDSFFTKREGYRYAVDYSTLSEYLDEYGCDDPYYHLSKRTLADLSKSFEMFYAVDQQPVVVVPLLRQVLGRDSLGLEQSGWMPAWDKVMQ